MVTERDERPVMTALKGPGWKDTFARAALHADTTIRKYIWRGFRPTFKAENEITVGDKSATDLYWRPLKRLLQGKRTYDISKDLLSNLNAITDSLIWSEKKSSDRTGIIDHVELTDDGGDASDPISEAKDSGVEVDESSSAMNFAKIRGGVSTRYELRSMETQRYRSISTR